MSSLFALLDLVFRLASLLFLIRFLLQASNADFYNHLSQAIIKVTDKVANPIRVFLKPYGKFDFASALVAYLISLGFYILFTVAGNGSIDWPTTLVIAFARTAEILLSFYWWSILGTIVSGFFVQQGVHPAIALLQELVEPLLSPARKLIPALGPIDLSPILVLFTLSLLQNFVKQIT